MASWTTLSSGLRHEAAQHFRQRGQFVNAVSSAIVIGTQKSMRGFMSSALPGMSDCCMAFTFYVSDHSPNVKEQGCSC